MKNKFGRLSESRKMELYQMNIEDAYNAGYAEGHETGYEVGAYNERTGVCDEPVEKSSNQRRAELIQRAREFVRKYKKDLPGHECRREGNKTCRDYFYDTEFHIKKRKVTAVVNRLTRTRKPLRQAIEVGRAKCAPSEVFNADIGKAIALAQALEIEIPQEFLDAVQPTNAVVGMELLTRVGAQIHLTQPNPANLFTGEKIIDDTHAEYEVPSC